MAYVGQVIDDKYEILKLIGQGGMSKVYLAMDKRLNKQWAVKEIEKRVRDKNNEVVVQSAIAEANMIKQFDHKAIVRIVDIIDNGDVIYIIEDYIEGETLSTILEAEGAIPQEKVIDWDMQLCEALEYLHTYNPPIIYRDMKPGNVMLKPDGTVKVIDFGIAREYKQHNMQDTTYLGTKGYAAPEQFGGQGQTDARTDIYGLGVTLYHLVTGQNPCDPPYEIYPIRKWNPQLSAGLEAIIQKCTQQNPADRYQSCAELLYALKHYEQYSLAYRAKQKKKLAIFLSSCAATLLFVLFGIFGLAMRANTNSHDYDNCIVQAEASSATEDKIEYYCNAIDIKPYENRAYYGLIDAFKNDASFTTEEETTLKKRLNKNISRLKENPDYAKLAYEIGKLYWYYYDYGSGSDNQITRMKSAVQWFNDTVKYGEGQNIEGVNMSAASIYSDIGTFHKEITLNIEEAEDSGKYIAYWTNLEKLIDTVKDENESELIQLDIYELCVYTIETYAQNLKGDGVTEEQMINTLDDIRRQLRIMSPQTEKTKEMKARISDRIDEAATSVENAFGKAVE